MKPIRLGKIDFIAGCPEIPLERVDQHTLIVGSSGAGKSTFLMNLLVQMRGEAIILLDPHGGVARDLYTIAKYWGQEAIYVSKHHTIGLNPLKRPHLAQSQHSNELSDMINSAVKSVSAGQIEMTVRMRKILVKALKLMGDSEVTIKFLSDFLQLKDVRNHFFEKKDRPLFWKEFELSGHTWEQIRMSASSISDRLSLLYEDDGLAPFICRGNDFDLVSAAKDARVYCFDLSGLDDEVVAFIGALIVFQVRSYYKNQATEQSPRIHLLIDEYHQFITDLLGNFLVECRKYHICTYLLGHSITQFGPFLQNMIMHCHTKIFLGGDGEADIEKFAFILKRTKLDLLDLPEFMALARIGRKVYNFQTFPPQKGIPKFIAPGEEEECNFLRNSWVSVL
jgi:type IV secretory pathway VirB4 component